MIGGGARARSAVYALSLLGLRPIFLLNRDDEEIERLMGFFPNLKKKKGLIYLKNTTDVVRHLAKPVSPVVLMVVGAIRAWDSFTHTKKKFFFIYFIQNIVPLASVAPVTMEEHMLYTTLSAVLKIPYKPPCQPGQLPLPLRRLFLEMTVRISQSPTDVMKRLLLLSPSRLLVPHTCFRWQLRMDGSPLMVFR